MYEAPEDALVREIKEELCVDIEVGPLVGEKHFEYPHRILRLRVYEAIVTHANLQLVEHDAEQWVLISELDPLILSEPDRPFVPLLMP
ncbi:hypothetical protein D3C72_2206860 [compost metagenome]